MTARIPIARIALDDGSELVVSIDERGRTDLRLWTPTGDLKFPSKHGLTVSRYALREVIAALREAKEGGQAIA